MGDDVADITREHKLRRREQAQREVQGRRCSLISWEPVLVALGSSFHHRGDDNPVMTGGTES